MKQIVLLGLAFVWALSACGGDKPAERAKPVLTRSAGHSTRSPDRCRFLDTCARRARKSGVSRYSRKPYIRP